MPRFVIIGNPENRRVQFFQEALQHSQQETALLIPYLSILNGQCQLQDLLKNGDIVRVESPGENFAVEQKILALGGLENAHLLQDQRGRIYYPGIWFKGFSVLMASIAQQAPQVVWMNHPDDIVCMFNKPLCKQLLPACCLPSLPNFSSYDEFFAFAEKQAYSRFFIKLNFSSSASGIVAYEYNKKNGKEQAYSTVEWVQHQTGDQYYNSLKIKKYTSRPAIKNIIDFLLAQGAFVETWVPKAQHQGYSYDLRVVSINGQPRHSIARLSHSPMTNLHLGNQRCLVDELDLPESTWPTIALICQNVKQVFAQSLYAGLDILLPRNGKLPLLLEVNAFGDLLPNLLHNNENTYQAEINAVLQRLEILNG